MDRSCVIGALDHTALCQVHGLVVVKYIKKRAYSMWGIQARDRIDTLIEQLEVESKRLGKKLMQQSHIFQLHGCTKQMENSENLGLCSAAAFVDIISFYFYFLIKKLLAYR
ncbi:hypothetical protein ACJX0J_039223, partial [Zea mays]